MCLLSSQNTSPLPGALVCPEEGLGFPGLCLISEALNCLTNNKVPNNSGFATVSQFFLSSACLPPKERSQRRGEFASIALFGVLYK